MMKKWVVRVTDKPLSGIMLIVFTGGMIIGQAYKIAVGPEKQKQI